MIKDQSTVELNHGQFEQVKFTDRDNHVFFMKVGRAIEVCRRLREWEADLERDEMELADIWSSWMGANRALFSAVLVRPHTGGLVLYFAPVGPEFNVRLSMQLATLESEAVSRLSALKVETRQVSQAELEELREMERMRQHADEGPAHQPVEA